MRGAMTQPLFDPAPSEPAGGGAGGRDARPMATSREAQVVQRIRAGDERVFDALMRELGPGLCTFAARYTGSIDAAEELVQDVFVNVWLMRERLVIRDTIKTYLYRSVRNRALNAIRDQETRKGLLARLERSWVADRDSGSTLAEPEARVQSAQLAAAVRRAVERLPARWRLAFQLVREHGLTYPEAAAVMGVTVKSVDMSLGRAMKALRESLRGVWP
jgi:RNA polymerase sigma-70 factor, ECF subfamily